MPLGKKIIYDVVANVTLHKKEEINVNLEMQNLYHKYLNERMAFYAMRKYSDKLKKLRSLVIFVSNLFGF